MPRVCTICTRSDAARIDADITACVPYSAIAQQYGVTKASVGRHAVHLRARLLAEGSTPQATAVECLPPAPKTLGEFFRERRIEQLSPRASVRQSGLHDIHRLEALIQGGIESGRADVILAGIKLKNEVLDRMGFLEHPDRPLFGWHDYTDGDGQGEVLTRMVKSEKLSAMFRRFARLTDILPDPGDIPEPNTSDDADGPILDGDTADHAPDMEANDTDGNDADDNDPNGPIVDGEAADDSFDAGRDADD